jgi:hypothetical protein
VYLYLSPWSLCGPKVSGGGSEEDFAMRATVSEFRCQFACRTRLTAVSFPAKVRRFHPQPFDLTGMFEK